jgi:glutathione S-transferase
MRLQVEQTITLYAFKWVPDFAKGLVRDLRVRWALEESGLPYRQKLIGPEEKALLAPRGLQPFGQIPVIENGELKLFESGAIVLHIAERSEALMPLDPQGRARTQAWMFAALNSIEPYIDNVTDIDIFNAEEEWGRMRRPAALAALQQRLGQLESWLGGKEYLEDRFTAGDLLMTAVLRILRHSDIVERRPILRDYKARCEARPAFRKALADHLSAFEDHETVAA